MLYRIAGVLVESAREPVPIDGGRLAFAGKHEERTLLGGTPVVLELSIVEAEEGLASVPGITRLEPPATFEEMGVAPAGADALRALGRRGARLVLIAAPAARRARRMAYALAQRAPGHQRGRPPRARPARPPPGPGTVLGAPRRPRVGVRSRAADRAGAPRPRGGATARRTRELAEGR